MVKKFFIPIIFCLCSARSFAQVYGTGNGDGFSYNCYIQADNPYLNIYGTGDNDGFAQACFDWYPQIVVPLRFYTFDAFCRDTKIIVQWSAASSLSGGQFIVERSRDGIGFQSAGTVPVVHSGGDINYYSFDDAGARPGKWYYRIRQAGGNSPVTHSKIIFVQCSTGDREAVNIFPNPTSDLLYIITAQPDAVIIIKNVPGQSVITAKASGSPTTISLRHLPPGLYFVVVQSAAGMSQHKIVKR